MAGLRKFPKMTASYTHADNNEAKHKEEETSRNARPRYLFVVCQCVNPVGLQWKLITNSAESHPWNNTLEPSEELCRIVSVSFMA